MKNKDTQLLAEAYEGKVNKPKGPKATLIKLNPKEESHMLIDSLMGELSYVKDVKEGLTPEEADLAHKLLTLLRVDGDERP